MAKWFRIVGVGHCFCTANELRSALGGYWQVLETDHSGVAIHA